MKLIKLILILTLLGIGYKSKSQDCEAILKYGIYDLKEVNTSMSQEKYIIEELTTRNFSNVSEMKEYAGGIDAILPLGIFSGDASSSKAKVQQAQEELKRLFEQSESFEEVVSIKIETINQTVVNAWRDCISNKQGLNAWYENIGDGEYSLAFRYTVDPKKENPITNVRLTKVRIVPNKFIEFNTRRDRRRALRGFRVGGVTKKIYFSADSCRNYSLDSEGEEEERWLYGNVLRCSPVPKIPSCPSFKLKTFTKTGSSGAHPSASVTVDEGYKIIGGGAKVNTSPSDAGNLLTSSYPSNQRTWVASSKDHSVTSHATISVYALAIFDPNDEWDVRIFQQTGETVAHPSATVNVEDGYVLSGGGAKVNWSGAGNLLTASFPSTETSWEVRSKDHDSQSHANVTAYAIGVRPRTECAQELETKIFVKTSGRAQHPSGNSSISSGYVLTGGGALINWNGYGNLLTSSYPSSNTSWSSSSKDHSQPSPATINIYAIGIKFE